MKKMNQKLKYDLLLLLILFGYSNITKSQDLDKTYYWSYPINMHGIIEITNYNCDIEIINTESDKIDFEIEIIAEGGSEIDIKTLDNYLNELKFVTSNNKIELSTILWKKKNQNLKIWDSKPIIILNNGKKLGFTKIEQKAYLKIPEYVQLKLSSEFSNLTIPNLEKLELDSYKDLIDGSNIVNPSVIKAKFSDIQFREISDGKLDVYKCKLKFSSMGNIELKSKFSNWNIGVCKDLQIECYMDRYQFKKSGDVTFNGEFTYINSTHVGELKINNSYKCNFESGDISEFNIKKSGFSFYKFASSAHLILGESYKDEFDIDKIERVKVTHSEFSKYKINNLEKSFSIENGYKNRINILKTTENYSFIDINSKFENIYIGILSTLPLQLDIQGKELGNINYNDALFTSKSLSETSIFKLNALRGKEINNMPYIKLSGYKNNLTINDIN